MELLQQSILNVDDYDPGRYARTKVLRQAGFHVIEAANGADTLDLVMKRRPSIVLLDVNLPDISGFEVCRKLRMNPETAATTILHISASSTQTQHQVHGLNSGADSYLVEPIDPAVLVATVKAFLRARKAEDALRRSNEDLERFAYMVAHDLNEPLRTITSYAQLLENRLGVEADKVTLQSLKFMVEGAGRMRSFIHDILYYAQATHRMGLLEPVNSELSLERVTASLETAIEASGAKITHGSLPVVLADSRLDHVFQNLISNAIKYSRRDLAPEIHISANCAAGKCQFSVRDNGIGIAPQYREKVFDVFRRLHGQSIPGSGLGLALCQRIIEECGGTIWVESEPGSGSTFHFTLGLGQSNASTLN
jgi:two-component system sensor histidine kinase/response regulator